MTRATRRERDHPGGRIFFGYTATGGGLDDRPAADIFFARPMNRSRRDGDQVRVNFQE
jgi:hypothetical protein